MSLCTNVRRGAGGCRGVEPNTTAVRETVEEAGSPSLLPLLSSSQYPATIRVGVEVEEINSIKSKLRLHR